MINLIRESASGAWHRNELSIVSKERTSLKMQKDSVFLGVEQLWEKKPAIESFEKQKESILAASSYMNGRLHTHNHALNVNCSNEIGRLKALSSSNSSLDIKRITHSLDSLLKVNMFTLYPVAGDDEKAEIQTLISDSLTRIIKYVKASEKPIKAKILKELLERYCSNDNFPLSHRSQICELANSESFKKHIAFDMVFVVCESEMLTRFEKEKQTDKLKEAIFVSGHTCMLVVEGANTLQSFKKTDDQIFAIYKAMANETGDVKKHIVKIADGAYVLNVMDGIDLSTKCFPSGGILEETKYWDRMARTSTALKSQLEKENLAREKEIESNAARVLKAQLETSSKDFSEKLQQLEKNKDCLVVSLMQDLAKERGERDMVVKKFTELTNDLEKKLTSKEDCIAKLQKDNSVLSGNTETIIQENKGLKRLVEQLQYELSKSKEPVSQLQKQVDDNSKTIEEFRKIVGGNESKLSSMQSSNQKMEQQLGRLQNENKKLLDGNQLSNEALAKVRNELESFKTTSLETAKLHQQQMSSLTLQNNSLESRFKNLQLENENLKIEKEKLVAEQKLQISGLSKQNELDVAEIARLKQIIAEKITSLTASMVESSDMTKVRTLELASKEEEIARLQSANMKLTDYNQEMASQMTDRAQKNTNLQRELQLARQEQERSISELSAKLESASQHITRLEGDIVKLKDEKVKLAEDNGRLSQAKETNDSEKRSKQIETASLRAEIVELRKQCAQFNGENIEFKKQLSAEIKSKEVFGEQNTKLKEDMRKVSAQLADKDGKLTAENNELKKEVSTLTEKMSALEVAIKDYQLKAKVYEVIGDRTAGLEKNIGLLQASQSWLVEHVKAIQSGLCQICLTLSEIDLIDGVCQTTNENTKKPQAVTFKPDKISELREKLANMRGLLDNLLRVAANVAIPQGEMKNSISGNQNVFFAMPNDQPSAPNTQGIYLL